MLPLDGLREKRLESAACVIELRRLAMPPLGPFSVDMLAKVRMLSMALELRQSLGRWPIADGCVFFLASVCSRRVTAGALLCLV